MEWICIGIVVLGVIIGVGQIFLTDSAKKAYYASLQELRKDPTNTDKRQHTLNLGRAYSNLTRNNKGVTVYDEMAIKNDIDAACAGAVHQVVASIPSPTALPDHAARLQKLRELLEQGHISQSEFDERRTRILDEV